MPGRGFIVAVQLTNEVTGLSECDRYYVQDAPKIKRPRYCEASRLKAATGWRTTFLLYTVKSPNSTEQGENMIDHYYVTHAQILALRNVVAFIVQTMPEEQKENVLQVLRKFAEIELMDGIDAPPTIDITPKTVEKLNKAYKAIFNDIIDLSTPGRESA